MAVEGIQEILPRLRQERSWSRDRLSHEAYTVDPHGTSTAQIAAIEVGDRRASARTMLALAETLGVEPTIFPEFRLAVARLAIDEDAVGLSEALEELKGSGLENVEGSAEGIKAASRPGRQGRDSPKKLSQKTFKRVKEK